MTTYTLRQNNVWSYIGKLLNIGTVFAINPSDPRPISPEPSTDQISDDLKKVLAPASANEDENLADPDADPSTSPTNPEE